MSDVKYTIAVVVDSTNSWRNWVSERVYESKPTGVSSTRFSLGEFRFVRILRQTDVRGWRFSGIVVDDSASNLGIYDEIMDSISTAMNA